jgi:hypothetical protein
VERVRKGQKRTYTAEDIRKELGLEDGVHQNSMQKENSRKDKISIIYNFLKAEKFASLATYDGISGYPEVAIMAFTETKTLEIIFGTFNTTRKYKSLQTCRFVAFAFFNGDITVQYKGKAREIIDEDEIKIISMLHIKKHPGSVFYKESKNERYFIVKPKWIRFSNINKKSGYTFDLKFIT